MNNFVTYQDLLNQKINDMAISRRIKKGDLGNIGYGFYVEKPKKLLFEQDETMLRINLLLDKFPISPSRVIFSSKSLNFCINQIIESTTYIIEVEKEYLQSVFELLKNRFNNLVLLKPGEKDKSNYWKPNTIYVEELFKRSPVNKNGTITIEKLIVDLLFSKEISSLYSGPDIESAIDVLCSKYTINYKTLFAYASRKQKREQLIDKIVKYIPEEILMVIQDD